AAYRRCHWQSEGPGAGHRSQRQPAHRDPALPVQLGAVQARAEQVLQILAAKTGTPARFSAEGRSDTEPLASNAHGRGSGEESSGGNHSLGGGSRV
ncbi:Outer membrane protein ImpK/VasF, OmpA/MotB domain, partial [Pseudomonas sp. FEN]